LRAAASISHRVEMNRVPRSSSSPSHPRRGRPRRQGHSVEVVLVAKVILVASSSSAKVVLVDPLSESGVSLQHHRRASVQSRDSYFQFLRFSLDSYSNQFLFNLSATFLHLPSVTGNLGFVLALARDYRQFTLFAYIST